MAELMYATGMRIGEVLRLTKDDIDFESSMIVVKGGKKEQQRIAYLNDYALKVVKIYVSEMKDVVNVKKGSRRIFGVGSAGTMIQTFHKKLDAVCKKHGIERFTSHNFRHTLGFHLLRRGCDMRYIQLILGHKDMNTTTIYTKVEKGDLRCELDTYHPRRFRRDADGTA
jgi:integrase/recombinase XerD